MRKIILTNVVLIALMLSFTTTTAQTLITHSTSQVPVAGSVACNAGNITKDNRYYREFDLANDFNIPWSFRIDSVVFAIEEIATAPAGGLPVDVNLYTVAAPGLPTGALTLIATTSVMLSDQTLTNVAFPLSVLTNAGDVIVMEVEILTSTTTSFFIGSNAAGQSDFGYIASDTCAIATITELGTLGFSTMHMIMNLKQGLCASSDVPTVTSTLNTVCNGASTTLNIAGNLNDAAYWAIYSGSCGGTLVGTTTTSTFAISPTGASTTYYVRGEGVCASASACGSTTVAELALKTGNNNTTICNEGSVVINGTTYNAASSTGTEIFTNVGPNNCDSTVTVALNVLAALTGSVTTTICNDDSVVVNGTAYNASSPTGTEVFANIGINNCDSTVTINLNVLAALTGSVTSTICNEGSVVVNGNTYDSSNPTGMEVITNVGPNSCDSTVTINLNVLAALTGSVTSTICNDDSIVVNGTVYNASNPTGMEVFANVGPNNCDSTVTINLNVLAAIDISVTNTSPTLTANQTGAIYRWLDCNNSNSVISGETGIAYTATTNGDYAVEITVGSCVDTSACESISTVGIYELDNRSISIYPNPTTDMVTVELEEAHSSFNYKVITITGKIVVAETGISTKKFTIDLSNESNGIYFLKVEMNDATRTYKVVKK